MSKEFNQLILLFDFDKTITHSSFPDIGGAFEYSKEVINKLYLQGCYIIINTCRTGRYELEAEIWLLEQGFMFHKINQHHPNGLLHYGNDRRIEHNMTSRKIWGHLIYDDLSIDWALNGHPGFYRIDRMTQTYISNLGPNNKYNILPNRDYSYIESKK